jgi:flagellar motor switch protein FliN/FliY
MADDELSDALASMGMDAQDASAASADAGSEEAISEDDWAAAMAEQEVVDKEAASATEQEMAGKVATPAPTGAQAANIFPSFNAPASDGSIMSELDVILDIPVQLSVELGRTRITIKNLLQLAHGSVVELDAMAGEPMDVLVNGTLIAQGEVVVVNDKFGIRLTDIITPSERMKKLGR